jgi:hypothetical protein
LSLFSSKASCCHNRLLFNETDLAQIDEFLSEKYISSKIQGVLLILILSMLFFGFFPHWTSTISQGFKKSILSHHRSVRALLSLEKINLLSTIHQERG